MVSALVLADYNNLFDEVILWNLILTDGLREREKKKKIRITC